MSVYKAPLQDMEFIFNEVLQVQDSEIPGYKDLDNDFLKSILN
ncbi:MAG: acyl-CoA dehydrogenase N-terminal domain-containing protein, partial [Paracoccaceae bacterium]